MDDFFLLSAPPRQQKNAQTKLMDILHAQDIHETASLLASLNSQLPADCTVLIQDLSELECADPWQAPWSPTRLAEALTALRMRPELETFRSRTGAHWFTIHAVTNPDLTDIDVIGDALAEARENQRQDLALELKVLSELGEQESHRASSAIPRYSAAIEIQLENWAVRPRTTETGTVIEPDFPTAAPTLHHTDAPAHPRTSTSNTRRLATALRGTQPVS